MKSKKKCLDCGKSIYWKSVRCRSCAAKLGTRKLTKAILERENIADMYSQGMSTKQIGEKVGLTAGAVYSLLKNRGITLRSIKDSLSLRYPNGRKGEFCANWKGGRRKLGQGYIYLYKPDHPKSTKQGYVMEHKLVAEKILGRYLRDNEVVHHLNGIKDDNRPQNLEIMFRGQHVSLHFDAFQELQEVKAELAKYKEKFGELK